MAAAPQVQRDPFGTLPDGTRIDRYTLAVGGLRLQTITYGAIITGLWVPDRFGASANVVLGHDALEPYFDNRDYLGAIVGRYANRIAGGRFTLDGTPYQLGTNDGRHHLHGGHVGFDRRVWSAATFVDGDAAGIRFWRTSPDGEEGYPGALQAEATYLLRPDATLEIRYAATCDRPTIVGLTQHSYFNLTGRPHGVTALDHQLTIAADRFTPVEEGLIPTGDLASVDGTPFDFRQSAAIGERLRADHPQLALAGGFDHNFVLRTADARERIAAELVDPGSGRALRVVTTEPGLQLYVGQMLGRAGGSSVGFARHAGLCLETQRFPDAPNRPEFPPVTLRPGERYASTTLWQFRTI